MRSWSRKLRNRLRPLQLVRSPGDLLLLLQLTGFALAVPILLRLRLATLSRLLEPRRRPQGADPERVRQIVALVSAVLWAGRPVTRVSCLPRGLTHYFFLRRVGLDVSLAFGMGREGETYAGHCWLVVEGEPFLEREDPRLRYGELYRLPMPASPAAQTPAVVTFPP